MNEPTAAGGYGSLGAKHPTAVRFFVIFWKKMAILMRFGSYFAHFQSHLKEQIFKILKPIEQIPPFTLGQVQNTFKFCILGLNFVICPKSGISRYITFCKIFSIK